LWKKVGEKMLTVFDHPLITHKLNIMRDKNTGTKDFRDNLDEIGGLMVYEVTRDLPLKDEEIETPICTYTGKTLAKDVVVVPILRAGLGMVTGILNLIPTAKVAHVGMYRDEETLEPHPYFEKYPKNIKDAVTIVVDPMLATGGSAIAAIDMVKKQGAKNIKMVSLVGAPEGVKALEQAHPDVDLYLAALDDHLNEHGYIVPGLGDAGDRIFGTK
jgi:uracil phosphoribosyltransferase